MLMLMTTTMMIDDGDGDDNDDRLSDMGVWVYARGNVITHRYPKSQRLTIRIRRVNVFGTNAICIIVTLLIV